MRLRPAGFSMHVVVPGAPVSMPIDWDDLGASPERWRLTTVPKRLKRVRVDPWATYWTADQEISDASFNAIKVLDGP